MDVSFIYLKPHSSMKNFKEFEISTNMDSQIMSNEPGLYLLDSIAEKHENGNIPAILVNSTCRQYDLLDIVELEDL